MRPRRMDGSDAFISSRSSVLPYWLTPIAVTFTGQSMRELPEPSRVHSHWFSPGPVIFTSDLPVSGACRKFQPS